MTVTNIRDILAKNMKEYRNARGFTQAKLAEKVDTSTHYIGMIETQKKFPSPEMIERIAIALGIDTLDLFKRDKKKPEMIKAYQKATIKQVKSMVGQFLDDRLEDLEK
jgi:transcriptional regulator with XRE-family HTH domain